MNLSLSTGDTIALIAPARKVSREEMQPAIKILSDWGYHVKEGAHLYASFHQFAGSDQQRLNDFQNSLDDPAVRAVLFARGGYGTVRLIDQLDFTGFVNFPKWLIGFSDLTVIHSHITYNFKIPTLHAPMAINFPAAGNEALAGIKSVLSGKPFTISAASHQANRYGEATGILTGGNLSVLYSMLGSASDVDTRDKILFIEDLDEYLYHIDRMMMAIKRSGKLSGLKGLIIGGMSDMKDNAIPFGFSAEQIIRNHVAA
ncbi:MAG: LD-carboxypeptidase, partial [Chitinophagaceae bacterium]|nr:LD-carboxypeptidase [Chitinophagaceae bacterium]